MSFDRDAFAKLLFEISNSGVKLPTQTEQEYIIAQRKKFDTAEEKRVY